MIPGTGCAIPCRVNIFSNRDIYAFDTTVIISSVCGLVTIIIMLVLWTKDPIRRKNDQLIIAFSWSAFITSAWFVIVAINNRARGGAEEHFCINNAVQREQSDGISMCTTQASRHCNPTPNPFPNPLPSS